MSIIIDISEVTVMSTRDKLKLAKEIDARNAQHLEDWKKEQEAAQQQTEKKDTEKEQGP